MKNRTLAILLTLTLLMPLALSYIFYHIKKYNIRKELKIELLQKLDKSQLICLKFTNKQINNELKWEHSYEFEYKGEMYDVVDFAQNGDTTYYWVWWDKEETKLNQQLTTMLNQSMHNDGAQKDNSKKLIDFLKLQYFKSLSNNIYKITTKTEFFFLKNFYTSKYFKEIDYPPKKLA